MAGREIIAKRYTGKVEVYKHAFILNGSFGRSGDEEDIHDHGTKNYVMEYLWASQNPMRGRSEYKWVPVSIRVRTRQLRCYSIRSRTARAALWK